MSRWLYGWYMWARAIYLVRRKKHGAGAMKWRYALKMGAAHRYVVDGQFRNTGA